MSNFAIVTKMNIYVPMREEIINKWGVMESILEEDKNQNTDKYAKEFTTNFLDDLLGNVFKTKKFSYLPLIYGINEDIKEEFKILVVVNFESTESGLDISNDKLIEVEINKFFDEITTLLNTYNCEYQLYNSELL